MIAFIKKINTLLNFQLGLVAKCWNIIRLKGEKCQLQSIINVHFDDLRFILQKSNLHLQIICMTLIFACLKSTSNYIFSKEAICYQGTSCTSSVRSQNIFQSFSEVFSHGDPQVSSC